jgi:hypothetical protein
MSSTVKHVEGVPAERIEKDIFEPMADFEDPSQEWRRLFSELYGTFLLVLVARKALNNASQGPAKGESTIAPGTQRLSQGHPSGVTPAGNRTQETDL